MINTGIISPNPYQPRKNFDAEKLQELAASFKDNGLIQPVAVRRKDSGYQLIAGERRLQAAKLAGIASIPAIVRDIDDLHMLQMSIIENVQRDDLNPLEEAMSYSRLTEEFNVSREQLAETIGKSRATVTNTMRMLKLPEEVRDEILNDRISRGHAVALLGLESPAAQKSLCKKIISEGLSVRETEALVKRGGRAHRPEKKEKLKSPELISIEDKLQMIFGTRVNINAFKKGGRIEIEYYSDEDLIRIFDALNVRTH